MSDTGLYCHYEVTYAWQAWCPDILTLFGVSLDHCLHQCLHSTGFVCASLDYHLGNCYLSQHTRGVMCGSGQVLEGVDYYELACRGR